MSHRSWNPRLAVVALMAIIVFLACSYQLAFQLVE